MVSKKCDDKPLREYLNDKKEMIEQMFSCIEDHQLKKMIPDVFKEVQIDDIKAECLVELLGMSRKRIIGILEGIYQANCYSRDSSITTDSGLYNDFRPEIYCPSRARNCKDIEESSSDSLELDDISDDEEEIKSETPETKKRKEQKVTKETKSTKKSRKVSSSESEEEKKDSPPKKKRLKKKIEESPVKETLAKKATKGGKRKPEESKDGKCANVELDLGLEMPPKKEGKNLLEILELEMRARAIRSLIEREEKKNKNKENNPEPSTSDKDNIDCCVVNDDPDDVIVIDGTADEIDLTKDDSDEEEVVKTMKDASGKISQDSINQKEDSRKIDCDKTPTEKEQINNSVTNRNQSFIHKTSTGSDLKQKENACSTPRKLTKQTDKNADQSTPKNWTERWLESNDVKKVMKTSKVLTNLKKRLINVNKQKSIEEKNIETEVQKDDLLIEGTVSEYSQLPSNRTNPDDTITEEVTNDEQISERGTPDSVDKTVNNRSSEESVKHDNRDGIANENVTTVETDKLNAQTTPNHNLISEEKDKLPVKRPVDNMELSDKGKEDNTKMEPENIARDEIIDEGLQLNAIEVLMENVDLGKNEALKDQDGSKDEVNAITSDDQESIKVATIENNSNDELSRMDRLKNESDEISKEGNNESDGTIKEEITKVEETDESENLIENNNEMSDESIEVNEKESTINKEENADWIED